MCVCRVCGVSCSLVWVRFFKSSKLLPVCRLAEFLFASVSCFKWRGSTAQWRIVAFAQISPGATMRLPKVWGRRMAAAATSAPPVRAVNQRPPGEARSLMWPAVRPVQSTHRAENCFAAARVLHAPVTGPPRDTTTTTTTLKTIHSTCSRFAGLSWRPKRRQIGAVRANYLANPDGFTLDASPRRGPLITVELNENLDTQGGAGEGS